MDKLTTGAADAVAERIMQRYVNPARLAYMYLFRLKPGSDLTPMIPDPDSVLAAWADTGKGLLPLSAEAAVEGCIAAGSSMLNRKQASTSHERRLQMIRSIQFTTTQPADDLVEVHLVSRALLFSPKGSREVFEQWRPDGDDWYFADHARPDGTEA